MEFLIITGLSGAGKSRAADVLEDLEYYCVDNMPVALMPRFAELCLATRGRYEKVALVTDARERNGDLLAMLDEESRDDLLRNKNLGIYKGALYENFVAEALSKSGYELFYYRKDDSTLEMDFFVRTADDLIPVEVKAGNTVSKSLRKLVESDKYGAIHTGIKLARANIGRSDAFLTIPYFCAFLLRRYLKAKTEI